jgi:hypothetical protein
MISNIFLMPTFSRGSVIQFGIHVANDQMFLHLIKNEPKLGHYFILADMTKFILKNALIHLRSE